MVIKKGTKISHSIIFDGTIVDENSEISHSVLGANNHVGKGVTLRTHKKNGTWHVMVKNKDVDTGMEDLGIFTADACTIPDGTVMMGGTLLNPENK